jgi:hypothetical protein
MTVGIQKTLWGYDKFIGDSRQRMMHLYDSHPEAFDSEKQMMLKYWEFFEQLDLVLEDKLEAFRVWFLKCTSPETLSRCHRSLKEDGSISLNDTEREQRQEQGNQCRQYWGNEKRLREDNENAHA